MIRIEHMRKEYPAATPLTDVNVEIHKGDVISVIGPSGTGKSTLLRCINMLERPTSGKIFINDTEVTAKGCRLHEIRQNMGMVFQSYNLFNHMNVYENIMYAPMKIRGMTEADARALADDLLEQVGLSGRGEAYPDEMSGGQKQRVAIARTLAMKPEIILFDEPTSALDPTMVGQVLSVIRKLAEQGMTMMIVTHEMEFARKVSNRIFYMDQGIIYEDGSPEQIFEHPLHNRTRQFIQRMKVLYRRIEGHGFDYREFSSEIDLFCRKHSMEQKKVNHAQSILEELCVGSMLPAMGAEGHLHFLLECSERDDKANVTLLWRGEAVDPLDALDPLERSILSGCAEEIVFEPGEDNNALHFTSL